MKKLLVVIFLLAVLSPLPSFAAKHTPHRYKDHPRVIKQAGVIGIQTTKYDSLGILNYNSGVGLNYRTGSPYNYNVSSGLNYKPATNLRYR